VLISSRPVIRSAGFNLIELMVAVVIIGVLAALAYPSYLNSVRDARRADAQGALITASSYMERKYTETNRYDGFTLPAELSTNYYTITASDQSANTFTLEATPTGAQIGDRCGTLSITDTGIKLPSNCW
jgi:type IV pilus assembly protein PilE